MEYEIGVEEARKRLGDIIDAAAVDGTVTYVTRRGKRFAGIVPLDRIAAQGEPTTLDDAVQLYDAPAGLIIGRGPAELYLLPSDHPGRFAADAAAWLGTGTFYPPIPRARRVDHLALIDAISPASWSPENGVVLLTGHPGDDSGYTMSAAARAYLGKDAPE